MASGKFALFANDRKTGDRQPDARGKLVLDDGRELRLSAWWRDGKGCGQYLSGAWDDGPPVAPTKSTQQPPPQSAAQPQLPDVDKDDIPF